MQKKANKKEMKITISKKVDDDPDAISIKVYSNVVIIWYLILNVYA